MLHTHTQWRTFERNLFDKITKAHFQFSWRANVLVDQKISNRKRSFIHGNPSLTLTADQEHKISLPRSKCIGTGLPSMGIPVTGNQQHLSKSFGYLAGFLVKIRQSCQVWIWYEGSVDYLITDNFLHCYEIKWNVFRNEPFFQQRPLSLQEVGALPHICDCKYLCQLHKWQGHQVSGSLGFSTLTVYCCFKHWQSVPSCCFPSSTLN